MATKGGDGLPDKEERDMNLDIGGFLTSTEFVSQVAALISALLTAIFSDLLGTLFGTI